MGISTGRTTATNGSAAPTAALMPAASVAVTTALVAMSVLATAPCAQGAVALGAGKSGSSLHHCGGVEDVSAQAPA